MMCRLLTLFWVMMAASVLAAAPPWTKELTREPLGPYLKVPPCEVTYELGWNNWVTAGKASLRVREAAGGFWRADATAASTGFARTLWKYDCEMTSIIERAGIRPRYLQHSETDSAENCRYRVSFEPSRVVTETVVSPAKGSASMNFTLCPYGPMDDLLSVILYVRSQALTPGQKVTRVVQPWDKPYLTTFEVLDRETLDFGGQKRPCIKLSVKIRKIDRNSLELSSYKKMKTSTIWISDDALRLPIEMHAEVYVGYMSARVTQVKMLEGKAATVGLPGDMGVSLPRR
ncbi:MAG: DUF3108 domain-containing protein [Prosthecobacter sp.]